jgi:hypothetical protein
VTREFLGESGEFTLESQRQLLPFADGVDGAYVAAMRRADPADPTDPAFHRAKFQIE